MFMKTVNKFNVLKNDYDQKSHFPFFQILIVSFQNNYHAEF